MAGATGPTRAGLALGKSGTWGLECWPASWGPDIRAGWEPRSAGPVRTGSARAGLALRRLESSWRESPRFTSVGASCALGPWERPGAKVG